MVHVQLYVLHVRGTVPRVPDACDVIRTAAAVVRAPPGLAVGRRRLSGEAAEAVEAVRYVERRAGRRRCVSAENRRGAQ